MWTGAICICLTLFSWLLHPLQASEITLTANPNAIKGGLTKTLTLRCSLQLNRASDGTSQGRAKQFKGTVNSIAVTRDSKILVAKISTMNPKIVSDEGTVTAQGNLTARTSYLQLTWTKPGVSQSGIYTCEIKATDKAGHNVMYKSNIQVLYQRPSEEDIIQYITELEERLSQTQDAVQRCDRRMKTDLSDVRTLLNNSQSHLQVQIDNLSTIGMTNSAAVQRFETRASSLSTNVTAIQNTLGSYEVEQGSISFGNTASFQPTGDGTTRTRIIYAKFTKIFSKLPTVTCSLHSLDAEKGTNMRFYYYISDLSTAGFNLHFQTWADTIFYGSNVQWTASIP